MKSLGVVIFFLFILITSTYFIGKLNQSRSIVPPPPTHSIAGIQSSEPVPEIAQIKTTTNLDEQVKLYTALIERAGPAEAQEQLQKSGLPFDGQTHLLNHIAGDWLFNKYGTSGLEFCKDYFLSSCYHGFVIKAAAVDGLNTLEEVMKLCQEKGSIVSVQCAHAIGHGLLAWVGYANLPDGLKKCDELSRKSSNFPLFNCHDGVFMENIWAVHEDGKPSPDRWLKDSDPIYPCNESKIEEKYKNACWSNQPMRMYQMFGGDVAKVGSYCLKLTNSTYQSTCFDGLARQIHPITKGSVDETFNLCSKLPPDWITPCLSSIAKAAFSVGDRNIPYQICARIEVDKDPCYEQLTGIISVYLPDASVRKVECQKILDPKWQEKCSLDTL